TRIGFCILIGVSEPNGRARGSLRANPRLASTLFSWVRTGSGLKVSGGQEVERQLKPYRGKMTPAHFAMLEKQYRERRCWTGPTSPDSASCISAGAHRVDMSVARGRGSRPGTGKSKVLPPASDHHLT